MGLTVNVDGDMVDLVDAGFSLTVSGASPKLIAAIMNPRARPILDLIHRDRTDSKSPATLKIGQHFLRSIVVVAPHVEERLRAAGLFA